ncbi:glycosyltransferase [gut metagenome]|uniref:Glycosyltransferase n=1 Tax=gut metagenome TaxID=749906 RepID=J9GJU2_9ZZZZ
MACNFVEGSTCSDEKIAQLRQTLAAMGVDCIQIDFARNVLKVGQNLKAYRQTRKLVKLNHYNLIHSHSPIGGLLSRLAARDLRKQGTKVIYTAHGFHFFNGAPLLNWLIFYPIEKISSRWTDVLVTITHEDYQLATQKMYAKKVVYVPGVGIDTQSFLSDSKTASLREEKRKELGFTDQDILMLSVGELNKNKNHEVILRAMAQLGNKRLKYAVAGRGILKDHLEQLASELGIAEQLCLLGFRSDVRDLFKAADLFAHPSFREGLSVAVMEAMASGLPIICTEIRGNVDLIDNGKGGFWFHPADVNSAAQALKNVVSASDRQSLGDYNRKKAEGFDIKVVLDTMKDLYQ